MVSNAVGTGIKPQSKAKNAEFSKAVQALWLRWSDEADSHGVHDFYGLQASICRSMIEGGECFVRFRVRRTEDGLSVPLQLQALESEHLDTSVNRILATGNMVRNGIEFNKLGQREAYYLFREHPGEKLLISNGESVRIPPRKCFIFINPTPRSNSGRTVAGRVRLKLYELIV